VAERRNRPPRGPAVWIVIAAIALILVGAAVVGGFLLLGSRSTPSPSTAPKASGVAVNAGPPPDLQVRDCLRIEAQGTPGRAHLSYTKDMCSNPAANVFVINIVASNGDCPHNTRISVPSSDSAGQHVRVCFAVNWIEGQCYLESPVEQGLMEAAPCSAAGHVTRVASIHRGTIDSSLCAAGQEPLVFTELAYVVCTTRP